MKINFRLYLLRSYSLSKFTFSVRVHHLARKKKLLHSHLRNRVLIVITVVTGPLISHHTHILGLNKDSTTIHSMVKVNNTSIKTGSILKGVMVVITSGAIMEVAMVINVQIIMSVLNSIFLLDLTNECVTLWFNVLWHFVITFP